MLTCAKAKELNLDVYMFADSATGLGLQTDIFDGALRSGRTAEKFSETVRGFVLLCVAVGPRPASGEIARDMKQRKLQKYILDSTPEHGVAIHKIPAHDPWYTNPKYLVWK